jgi:excisionase family DNA binding protein
MKALSKFRKAGGIPGVLSRLPKEHAVYTVAEVAHAFGVSVTPVYHWLYEGLMNFARVGVRKGAEIRIARESVVQMLEKLKMADDAGKLEPRRKRPPERPQFKRSRGGEYKNFRKPKA